MFQNLQQHIVEVNDDGHHDIDEMKVRIMHSTLVVIIFMINITNYHTYID